MISSSTLRRFNGATTTPTKDGGRSYYDICNYVNSRVRSKCFVGECKKDERGYYSGECEGDNQCSQRVSTVDFGGVYDQSNLKGLFNRSGVCYGVQGTEGYCSCKEDFGCG